MKRSWVSSAATGALLLTSAAANASYTPDTLGDTTAEPIHIGLDGASRKLSDWLVHYTDPTSDAPAPFTRPDGDPLVIGDLSKGEDPAASDQLQYQRFHVGGAPMQIKVTYFGEVKASFKSLFGLYTYDASSDPIAAPLTLHQLFVQNVDPEGSEVLITVPANHYFGFYLNADAYDSASDGLFFSENFRNSDTTATAQPDHFLMFETNRGMVMAIEDKRYKNGMVGDGDYNDIVIGFDVVHYAVPEPATGAVIATSAVLALRRQRRAY